MRMSQSMNWLSVMLLAYMIAGNVPAPMKKRRCFIRILV
jgi:hypothetical protein